MRLTFSVFIISLMSIVETSFSYADDSREQSLLQQPYSTLDGVSFHQNMFMLPFTYNDRFTGSETEVMFQLSVKARLFEHVFFGYTQRSFWQAYATEKSSPFRETNYNPEVFFRYAPNEWWLSKVGLDIGFEHSSNGRAAPDSRSWNKVYAGLWYPREHDRMAVKVLQRLHESGESTVNNPVGDDNPDILDYYGHTQFEYARCWDGADCLHLWEIKVRGNWNTGKGALETHWAFPTGSKQISWYVLLFSGYGESLIDYNHAETRLGIGFTLQPR